MIVKFTLGPNAKMPTHANETDAGYDLYYNGNDVSLFPNAHHLFQTGISWEPMFDAPERIFFKSINMGVYAHICDRSGLALKAGLTVLGGIVDTDYRGDIGVILYNTSLTDTVLIKQGDKIAQIVFTPCFNPRIDVADILSTTTRGSGGFGSTGN